MSCQRQLFVFALFTANVWGKRSRGRPASCQVERWSEDDGRGRKFCECQAVDWRSSKMAQHHYHSNPTGLTMIIMMMMMMMYGDSLVSGDSIQGVVRLPDSIPLTCTVVVFLALLPLCIGC